MIRIILFLALLLALAAGLSWFADHPGTVTINWLGYEASPSVFQAVILLFLLAVFVAFALWLVLSVVNAPRRIARWMERRRQSKGMRALEEGIFAAGTGDEAKAAKAAALAQKYMPNSPLTRLLRAQAAQLSGDRVAAQRIFTSMLEDPQTRLLGLRGLFQEARREGQIEAAKLYVREALSINPALPWPSPALFEFQCREHDWNGALDTLAIARQHRIIDRATADRRRAVLLTALASEAEERGDSKALELALEAHRLAPALVPAAVIAGRMLAAEGNTQKAARIISQTWELAPHPDLALVYAHARPGDSPRDRLARVKTLAGLTPGHPEAAIAVATAAIEAREWEEARAALADLVREKPSARVCVLMARIEGGEKRDAGRVREWLARALRAPRDPAWIADGVVSAEWAPLSPVTQTLDAFVWEVPSVETRAAADDERALAELAALEFGAGETVEAGENAVIIAEEAQHEVPVSAVVRAPAPAPRYGGENPVEERAGAAVAAPRLGAGEPGDRLPADLPVRLPPAFPDGSTGWEPAEDESRGVAKERNTPATATEPLSQQSPKPKRTGPKIFVPQRPPDDPGPESINPDEVDTPLTRFRAPLKDPA